MIDGTDQPGFGGTTLSVTDEGPDAWKVIRKKDGHMLLTANWKLSEDGNTLTDEFSLIAPNGSASTVNYVYKRTGGGAGFAGDWVSTSEAVNFVYLLQIRPYEGDGLSIIDSSSELTRNMKLDGKEYPNAGPNAAIVVASSIRQLDEHTLELRDRGSNSKSFSTREIKLSSDLNTLTMTQQGSGRSEPQIFVFERVADNPFVGDWKLSPSKSKLTDEMKVESAGGDKYTFNFGGGNETIAVDGRDQPGGYGTTLSVAVEGPNAWKVIRKKDGRMLITANWTLSKDGSTLTDDFTGINANGSSYNLKYLYQRTGGGSGFSGDWVSTSEAVNTVVVLQVRPYEGDGLSFINLSDGTTTNLKFDGKDYPVQGANVTGLTSSIRRVNEHTLEMNGKFNGKPRNTQQVELSSDLKSLTMTVHRVGRSVPNILVFERQ